MFGANVRQRKHIRVQGILVILWSMMRILAVFVQRFYPILYIADHQATALLDGMMEYVGKK